MTVLVKVSNHMYDIQSHLSDLEQEQFIRQVINAAYGYHAPFMFYQYKDYRTTSSLPSEVWEQVTFYRRFSDRLNFNFIWHSLPLFELQLQAAINTYHFNITIKQFSKTYEDYMVNE